MAIVTKSIAMPEELFEEMDKVAARLYTNRSQLIVRVWQEWKAQRDNQPTPAEEVPATGATEVR